MEDTIMEDTLNASSLLPYLDSHGARFSLRLSLVSEDAAALEKAPFPFVVITDSDPLSRLIEARLVTDTGNEIKRVFLMVQKDQYLLTRDDLRPIGNQDIDAFWQKAYSFYDNGKENSSFITLASQTDRQRPPEQGENYGQKGHRGHEGRLLPFQSMFFCKKRSLFFAPPCPICGLPIQQCYDDTLLTKLGLQPYSTSLKRYLFCPSCMLSGKSSNFYTFGLESFGSPGLKDRWDLIRGFRGLLRNEDPLDHQFLCRTCPESQECYGLDSHFLTRIVPFSFYPFYLFMVEAMSIHALDFLALMSGASFDEIETQLASRQEFGRVDCLKAIKQGSVKGPAEALMFFNQAERHFLEVLYLKLSFMSEVVQKISTLSGSGIGIQPDLGLSLDQIWVNLANRSSLLPLFWSFSAQILSLGESPSENSSFSRILPSYGLHVLGLIWFYTLLVNRKQPISKVYQLLRESMASENGATSGGCLGGYPSSGSLSNSDRIFSPENIFWNPQERAIDKSCHSLWEKALNLGWSLLRTSLHYSPQWSREEFWRQIETLRAEVKNALFQGNAFPLLQENTSALLQGNSSPLSHENSSSLFQGNTSPLLQGNSSAMLQGNTSPLSQGNSSLGNQSAGRMERGLGYPPTDNNRAGLLDEYQNSSNENNAVIHDILTRITDRWREGVETEKKPAKPDTGEEELAAWASSNKLGEWTPSNQLDNWASSDELEVLDHSDELDEASSVKEAALNNDESEQDDFLAKATAMKSERKT